MTLPAQEPCNVTGMGKQCCSNNRRVKTEMSLPVALLKQHRRAGKIGGGVGQEKGE